MEASSRKDETQVAAIDQVVSAMRSRLTGDDLDLFNTHLRFAIRTGKDDAWPSDKQVDVSPIGLAIALIGALAMPVAVFLPYADAKSFARVRSSARSLCPRNMGRLSLMRAT
jgi:hypothetical protein